MDPEATLTQETTGLLPVATDDPASTAPSAAVDAAEQAVAEAEDRGAPADELAQLRAELDKAVKQNSGFKGEATRERKERERLAAELENQRRQHAEDLRRVEALEQEIRSQRQTSQQRELADMEAQAVRFYLNKGYSDDEAIARAADDRARYEDRLQIKTEREELSRERMKMSTRTQQDERLDFAASEIEHVNALLEVELDIRPRQLLRLWETEKGRPLSVGDEVAFRKMLVAEAKKAIKTQIKAVTTETREAAKAARAPDADRFDGTGSTVLADKAIEEKLLDAEYRWPDFLDLVRRQGSASLKNKYHVA